MWIDHTTDMHWKPGLREKVFWNYWRLCCWIFTQWYARVLQSQQFLRQRSQTVSLLSPTQVFLSHLPLSLLSPSWMGPHTTIRPWRWQAPLLPQCEKASSTKHKTHCVRPAQPQRFGFALTFHSTFLVLPDGNVALLGRSIFTWKVTCLWMQ